MRFMLSVDLVNTQRVSRGQLVDVLAVPADARTWLDEHGLAGLRPTARELAALRALRDAIREVLMARLTSSTPRRAAIDALNAATVPSRTVLSWPGGPVAERRVGDGSRIAQVLGVIAADAIDAVTDADIRLARCASPTCVRVFQREHGRQRWCSISCGDRVRAARYYARRHTS
jgi:predicted RNA-binding Zn ribbon-like protein